MTEIDRIVDQLRRSFEGRAWHGKSVKELLDGVSSEDALSKPIKGRHSIWELVLHMAAWEDAVRSCLEGEQIRSLPPEEDWPPIPDTGDVAWRKAIEMLERIHQSLVKTTSEFSEGRLDETVPGAKYSFHTMLHGVVQHDLYHAGQIAILKRK